VHWARLHFIIYNNYKNHIINNKSDKNKILNLRMAARTASGAVQTRNCQWRGAVKTPLAVTRFSKDATDSDAFT
jgi:Tol biopolymer transport system component